jgi:PEGA domain
MATADAFGEPIEQLQLCTDLAALESAVRERVSRLINFRHVRYVRLRGSERLTNATKDVVVTYDAVPGTRLSEFLDLALHAPLRIDIDTALQIVRELLPAIAVLHDSRNVTHGAIAPERLVLTPQGRLVIVDHGLGLALGKLGYSRKRFWQQLRVPVPQGTGKIVFDARTDVIQIGMVALALILGRPLEEADFPQNLEKLLDTAKETPSIGSSRALSNELRAWLDRALPLEKRVAFATVREAQQEFEKLFSGTRYASNSNALKTLVTKYAAVAQGKAPVEDVPAAAAPEPIGAPIDNPIERGLASGRRGDVPPPLPRLDDHVPAETEVAVTSLADAVDMGPKGRMRAPTRKALVTPITDSLSRDAQLRAKDAASNAPAVSATSAASTSSTSSASSASSASKVTINAKSVDVKAPDAKIGDVKVDPKSAGVKVADVKGADAKGADAKGADAKGVAAKGVDATGVQKPAAKAPMAADVAAFEEVASDTYTDAQVSIATKGTQGTQALPAASAKITTSDVDIQSILLMDAVTDETPLMPASAFEEAAPDIDRFAGMGARNAAKAIEVKPAAKAPEAKAPEAKASEVKAPEAKTPAAKAPAAIKTAEPKATEAKPAEPKAPTLKVEVKAPAAKALEVKAPAAITPTVNVPTVNAPAAKAPAVTAPAATTPAAGVPAINAPAAKTPALNVPLASEPALALPEPDHSLLFSATAATLTAPNALNAPAAPVAKATPPSVTPAVPPPVIPVVPAAVTPAAPSATVTPVMPASPSIAPLVAKGTPPSVAPAVPPPVIPVAPAAATPAAPSATVTPAVPASPSMAPPVAKIPLPGTPVGTPTVTPGAVAPPKVSVPLPSVVAPVVPAASIATSSETSVPLPVSKTPAPLAAPVAPTPVTAPPAAATPSAASPVAAPAVAPPAAAAVPPIASTPVAATPVAPPPMAPPVLAPPVAAVTPVVSTPVTAAPVTAAPVTAAPVAKAPVAAPPVVAAPVVAPPAMAPPAVAPPAAAVTPVVTTPVTAAPVAKAPVAAPSVVAAPVVAPPPVAIPSLPEPELFVEPAPVVVVEEPVKKKSLASKLWAAVPKPKKASPPPSIVSVPADEADSASAQPAFVTPAAVQVPAAPAAATFVVQPEVATPAAISPVAVAPVPPAVAHPAAQASPAPASATPAFVTPASATSTSGTPTSVTPAAPVVPMAPAAMTPAAPAAPAARVMAPSASPATPVESPSTQVAPPPSSAAGSTAVPASVAKSGAFDWHKDVAVTDAVPAWARGREAGDAQPGNEGAVDFDESSGPLSAAVASAATTNVSAFMAAPKPVVIKPEPATSSSSASSTSSSSSSSSVASSSAAHASSSSSSSATSAAGASSSSSDSQRMLLRPGSGFFGADAAAEAEEQAETVVPFKAPRRQMQMPRIRINWRRTLAASVVVSLLEGVAFATAYWYVVPTESGSLLVETTPPGIEILVDGRSAGRTPFSDSLAPGRHTIELRQGSNSRVLPVEISAGVQTMQRITWAKGLKTGQARVTATAANAHVTIDGKKWGKAPLTISTLAAGKHMVQIESDAGTVNTPIAVSPGETTELDVPIYPGWVSVLAPVQLLIYEGERFLGTTEGEKLMLAPGKHTLDFVSEELGFKRSVDVTITPGSTAAVSLPMPKVPVTIEGPEGADLLVDGEAMGKLPLTGLQVPLGTRDFVVKHPELGEKRQVVTATNLAPVRVNLR